MAGPSSVRASIRLSVRPPPLADRWLDYVEVSSGAIPGVKI